MGWLFLWILSFGQTKESIPPAGAGTGIKKCRDSDTKPNTSNNKNN
jgi:hypothetical protein